MSGHKSDGMGERELSPCRICGVGLARARNVACDRNYLQCERCHGTFAALNDLPSKEFERTQYELHENDPDDPHYRRFVGHLIEPLIERLSEGAEGLDYGCGNGPAGAAMLAESGFDITFYDPFFAPDESALQRDYDFICCEVAEHFHDPAGEFSRLDRLLRPGGILAVMTAMEYSDVDFSSWHYRRDPTHVAFYKPDTMLQIAIDRSWQMVIPSRTLFFFGREAEHGGRSG